jgi:hypothetical protein
MGELQAKARARRSGIPMSLTVFRFELETSVRHKAESFALTGLRCRSLIRSYLATFEVGSEMNGGELREELAKIMSGILLDMFKPMGAQHLRGRALTTRTLACRQVT